MFTDLQPWVCESAKLPIAFAQVREDSLIDLEVVKALGNKLQVAMIASGGCTSAALISSARVSHLHLVDCNASQIALTRMKVDLLQKGTFARRMQVLGHAPMAFAARKQAICEALDCQGLGPDTFGPIDFVSQVGPDHSGRYERVFYHLRERLKAREDDVQSLMRKRSPARQAEIVSKSSEFGAEMDAAFREVMSLPNLVALFGEGATNNPVMPFGEHFAWRTRHVLETLPASSNPYVAQVIHGRFVGASTFPWLKMPKAEKLPEIICTVAPMKAALEAERRSFDFVHLSNILDWLTPQEAEETLDVAHRSLRPGGMVLVRQLNSTLDVQSCGRGFTWLNEDAGKLHEQDRSYFYRQLHLGKKR